MMKVTHDIIPDNLIYTVKSVYYAFDSHLDDSLFFVISSIGRLHCKRYYSHSRGQGERDDYLLFYVTAGCLEVNMDGNVTRVEEKEIFILDCSLKHSYAAVTDNTQFTYVHFGGCNTARLVASIYSIYSGAIISHNFTRQLKSINGLIDNVSRDITLPEGDVSALIYTIFCQIINQDTPDLAVLHSPLIASALDLISQDYDSVECIARALNISPQYLTRQFKKEVDIGTKQYIINHRLTKAQLLLQQTNRSIEDIAEECGFLSQSNFIKAFSRCYRMTPHNYRRQGGHNNSNTDIN